MSGVIWSGARASNPTLELENKLREAYGLTREEQSVVGQIVHTLTFYKTYTHDEVEERLRVLLDHGQPARKRR